MIEPIKLGDKDARLKMDAVIAEANKVAGKADKSDVTTEARQREDADGALQRAIDDEASSRAQAITDEAQARAEGDSLRATFGEAAGQHARPGEPGRFATADLGGAPDATTPLPDSLKSASPHGAVVALQAGYVAPRAVYRVEPGRRYRLRFVFQRAQDTLDPANDAVRLGIAWLKGDKALLTEAVLADILDITVQSGRVEFNYALSRHDADDVDVVAPADAVYLRPFVRVYGSGLTHVEVIEFADISSALDWAPDVDEFRRQLAGMEFDVTSLLERVSGTESLLEQARDARFIESGTLDDERLSANVLLRDAEQTVTGAKTFLAALLMGAAARLTGDGDSFAIAPTDGTGGFDSLKEFGFNLLDGFWRFENDLRVATELRAGSLQATPIGALIPAAAKFTAVDFTDKPTTRTNLDVYSKAETDNRFENFDALVRKGAIDCSTNPNYPAANAGYVWIVSQPGKIGGAAGVPVEAGDFLICNLDGSPAGTQAAVGANWTVGQLNIDISPFARTLLDDPDAAAMRATLGLVIGAQVQAYDAMLQALAGLTTASGKGLHFAGADTPALHDLTAFALTLLDDADAAAARTTLGLGSVDNTSDADKPVSTAQAAALLAKLGTTGTQTLVGNLILDAIGAGTSRVLYIQGDAGSRKRVIFRTGTVNRWAIDCSDVAEAGGNAGSDLQFTRFSDAGVAVTSWEMSRATGDLYPYTDGGAKLGSSTKKLGGAFINLTDYADDAAASAGGIAVGQLYRTGSAVKIRVT